MANPQSNAGRYDPQMRILAGTDKPHLWYDPAAEPFRLRGLPWFERDGVFRRMPANPAEALPAAVDALANCTAGAQVAFRSDSRLVAVRVRLDGLADMVHMPATGQCGLDLYISDGDRLRFCGSSKYDHRQDSYETPLLERRETSMQSFVVNFPLYRGVKDLRIGLAPEAKVLPPQSGPAGGPIIIYGTSITQGGCASRPGMAYTNILSRRLGIEVVNLGFSGNGRGEAHVIRTVASTPIAPSLFVLDYQANGGGHAQYSRTLPESVAILRRSHPGVPVLVVSRIAYARDLTNPDSLADRQASHAMQTDLVASLRADGDTRVHYHDATTLLGDDFDECTVDGVHPNDLGFMRMADGLEPTIRKILKLD